jgi:NADH-quinone oxidoreductase subunit E
MIDLAPLRAVLDALDETRGMLIPLLQETQRIYGYVPEEAAALIADRLGIFPAHVYGVLTFYSQFHLTPRGKHTIRGCCGTACHVRGGDQVIERLEKVLGVGHGGTTPDGAFSFERVACVGACAMAPLVVVDGDTHGAMDPAKAERLVKELRKTLQPTSDAKAPTALSAETLEKADAPPQGGAMAGSGEEKN